MTALKKHNGNILQNKKIKHLKKNWQLDGKNHKQKKVEYITLMILQKRHNENILATNIRKNIFKISMKFMKISGNFFQFLYELELPSGWKQALTKDNKVYYINDDTKVTQWEHPAYNCH